MTDIETALTPISQARQMLAEAKTLPQFKELRDYATAARTWAQARGVGIEAENEAVEIVLRAEREIGTAINALDDEGKLLDRGRPEKGADRTFITTDELGLDRKAIARFRALARLDADVFEALIATARGEKARLVKSRFYDHEAREAQLPPKEARDALRDLLGDEKVIESDVFKAWMEASDALDLQTLSADELTEFAVMIKTLVALYNAERERR